MKILLATLTLLIAATALNAQTKGDTVPQYPGGRDAMFDFIRANYKYPQKASDCYCASLVMFTFMVEENGEITGMQMTKGADCNDNLHETACDSLIANDINIEAMRVAKLMPRWIPAQKNGKPVRALATYSIKHIVN